MRITANQVTFARLVAMAPLAVMLYGGRTSQIVAVLIGIVVGCTDFVDGWLARKYGPTVLGGLMDPIADKIFIAVGFIPFVDLGWIPWWPVMLLFLREFVVTALRSSYEDRHLSLRTTYLAKVKTWVQMIGIAAVFAQVMHAPRALVLAILAGGAGGALLGGLLARLVWKRAWRGSWVFAGCFGVTTAVYALASPAAYTLYILVAVLAITWASGLDYVVVGIRELGKARDFHLFDAVRLAGAGAFPTVALLALVHAEAPVWAILGAISLELAVGGLDNLLAHHRAAQGPAAWSARILGASALLGATLVLPDLVVPLSAAALAVSASGTAIAFFRNRRFYLEEKLREKKRKEPRLRAAPEQR